MTLSTRLTFASTFVAWFKNESEIYRGRTTKNHFAVWLRAYEGKGIDEKLRREIIPKCGYFERGRKQKKKGNYSGVTKAKRLLAKLLKKTSAIF